VFVTAGAGEGGTLPHRGWRANRRSRSPLAP
jgi:hypothetical protein